MELSRTFRTLSDVLADIESTGATPLDADVGDADGEETYADVTVCVPVLDDRESATQVEAREATLREDGRLVVDFRVGLGSDSDRGDAPPEDPSLATAHPSADAATDQPDGPDPLADEPVAPSDGEANRGGRHFLLAQLLWLLVPLAAVAAAGAAVEMAFLGWFVGFLALVELAAPLDIPDRWRIHLRWVLFLALVGFTFVVGRRAVTVVG